MELTGLKQAINTGVLKEGSSLNSSQSNSRTLKHKQINNEQTNNELPKFANGLPGPGVINTSLINTSNSLTSSNGSSLLDPNGFGGSNYKQPIISPHIDWSNGTQSAMAIGQTGALVNSFGSGNPIDVNKSNQMLSKQIGSTIKPTSKGSGIGVSNIGGIITSGVQFAGDTINAFSVNETGDDIAKRQGSSNLSIGGIGYESPNTINVGDEIDKIRKENTGNTLKTVGSGAALGTAILPGWGTAIGAVLGLGIGLFGGEARKREYRRMMAKQNAKINALQDSARYSAQTKAIQLQNAREYGNSEAQYLYGAADGKVDTSFITPDAYFQTYYAPEIKEYNKNKLTYSALGPVNAEPNAKVSRGEIIANKFLGTMYRVPGGKDNKDTEYAYLSDSDTVVTNKGGESDRAFATGDIRQSEINMMNRNKKRGLMMAKNGKLPKCKEGWVGNAITSGLGAIGGLSQWWQANNSSPRETNVYKQNDYEGVSLDILSRLGINPFPITLSLRNAEARANKAIDMSGGLTTGQRTLTRLASLTNTQRAVADALQNIQMQNNNYFADYAKTALAAGAANAQRAMQANMYDEEMYAKAHAARQQGMQMGMRNIIDQLNNFYANEFKRRQFNEAMGLYKQDQKLRADEVQAIINNLNSNKNSNYSNYSHVNSIAPTYMGDYGLKKDWSITGNSKLKNPKLFWSKDYSLTAPVLPTSYAAYKYLRPYDNIRLR